MIWGREELEWAELVDATTESLAEQARLGHTTTYADLNFALHERTGARLFDFGKESDRAAMGALLGEVARNELPKVGALISSIVLYTDGNDAGPGFYRLAANLNLLPPKPTADQKLTFWTNQLQTVYDYYS